MRYIIRGMILRRPVITQEPQSPNPGDEYVVRIAATKSRPEVSFTIHNGPRAGIATAEPKQWQTLLSDEEKTNVMRRILNTYRQGSRNESGFKVGALAVSEAGNIYLGYNGSYNSSRQMRQCAELKLTARAEECETGNPDTLKFTELYVQGDGPGAHIAGLCGDCTNLMSKMMAGTSPITILPGIDEAAWLELDRDAKHIGDVQPGHAWFTSPAQLTEYREIKLDENAAARQRAGLEKLKTEIRDWLDRPIEEDPNVAVRLLDSSGAPIAVMGKAVQMAEKLRSKMDLPLDRLNTYMHEQIMLTVADRLQEIAKDKHKWGDLKDLDQTRLDQLIDEEINWARCVVTQRDDGKLFAAVTVKTKYEPASENAENSAMNQGRRQKGGVQNVYVMEMNPKKTKDGIMRTSAPVAVERQLKAASKKTGTVDYHYIPFNEGDLSARDVACIKERLNAKQVFPTGHLGRHNSNAEKLSHAREHDCGGHLGK